MSEPASETIRPLAPTTTALYRWPGPAHRAHHLGR
jgi:hypothetical protein